MIIYVDAFGYEYETKSIAPLSDYARETLSASQDYRSAKEFRSRGMVTLADYLDECAILADRRAAAALRALPSPLQNDEITHYHASYCEWRDKGFTDSDYLRIIARL